MDEEGITEADDEGIVDIKSGNSAPYEIISVLERAVTPAAMSTISMMKPFLCISCDYFNRYVVKCTAIKFYSILKELLHFRRRKIVANSLIKHCWKYGSRNDGRKTDVTEDLCFDSWVASARSVISEPC